MGYEIVIPFPPTLTSQTFDEAILDRFARPPWLTHTDDLFIDLSRIEFASLDALFKVALLVEGAGRHGCNTTVAMPLDSPTQTEFALGQLNRAWNPQARHAAESVRRRRNALRFLQSVGFISAIQPPHVPGKITPLWGYEASDAIEWPREPRIRSTEHPSDIPPREGIFPLRWVDPAATGDILRSDGYQTVIRTLRRMGVANQDAEAIVGIGLHELIENVRYHAQDDSTVPPRALLGGIVSDVSHYVSLQYQVPPAMRTYFSAVQATSGLILRILVGDSGAGFDIATTHRDSVFPSPVSIHGERSSAGLRRITRLIETYRGAILLESRGSQVGWTFEQSQGASVAVSHPAFPNGTLIQAFLPSRPEKTITGVPPADLAADDEVSREWYRCGGDPILGLSDEDLTHIDLHLGTTPSNQSLLVATVEGSPGASGWTQDVALSMLERATQIARARTLAVIVTTTTWLTLEPAAAALHERGIDAGTAVLVFDMQGEARWCGGTLAVRGLLTSLTTSLNYALSKDKIARTFAAQDSGQRLEAELRRYAALLKESNDGRIFLRWPPASIIGYFLFRIGRTLENAILNGHSGVQVGTFRTPTLAIVDRWLDSPSLIAQEVGISIAAFVLAQKIHGVVGAMEPQEWALVSGVPTPQRIVSALADSLGVRHYVIQEEFDPRHADAIRVPPRTKVIICSDVVASENTAEGCIREVVSSGARPMVVATLFDERRESLPMDISGRKVPVVCVCSAPIIKPIDATHEPIVDIDPVTREPVVNTAEEHSVPYGIAPGLLLEWCEAQTDLLCLGHIERPVVGHFSLYVNARALMRHDSLYRTEVVNAIASSFLRSRSRLGEGPNDSPRPVSIWFPGNQEDFAADIAAAVGDSLKASDVTVTEVRNIPRVSVAGAWAYPRSVRALGADVDVLIIDWRSLSGVTIQHLMWLAAQSGAASIVAVVLISHLPIEDELALRGIAQIRVDLDSEPKTSIEAPRLIPSRVTFVSRVDSARFRAYECPLCASRYMYEEEKSRAPTALLKRHAMRAGAALVPRERDAVLASGMRDLYGAPVTGRDLVALVQVRSILQAALRSTAAREAVRRELEGLPFEPNGPVLQAWIRLLAAERHWMKLPPLRFRECRSLLAIAALKLLTEPVADYLDVRVQGRRLWCSPKPHRGCWSHSCRSYLSMHLHGRRCSRYFSLRPTCYSDEASHQMRSKLRH